MKISVVINTFNSEQYLRTTLASVSRFDEIVVCDMHSTDSTIAIASEYGAKIVYYERSGIVEPARNYAISQASNEWVLVVDSDEVVPVELREYLYAFVSSPDGERFSGLFIPRKNYFMGRFMHGAYPDYILRLVRKSKTYWPSTIHATAKIDGLVTKIPRRRKELAFEHLANETIEQRIAKLNNYTNKEVVRRIGQSYTILGAFFKATHRFVRMYILKGGFRDGKAGYVNAMLDAVYKFVTISKLWEHDS